jgi:hypothetical protein
MSIDISPHPSNLNHPRYALATKNGEVQAKQHFYFTVQGEANIGGGGTAETK